MIFLDLFLFMSGLEIKLKLKLLLLPLYELVAKNKKSSDESEIKLLIIFK